MEQTEPTKRAGQPRSKPNLALLEARIRAGLSRRELGELAGISEKQVGLIERGKARYSRAETLAGIATALDQDVTELFALRHRVVARKRKARS